VTGTVNNYKRKALENPDVKAEYEALQPEYDIIQTMKKISGVGNKS
jgi:hypothetical protein